MCGKTFPLSFLKYITSLTTAHNFTPFICSGSLPARFSSAKLLDVSTNTVRRYEDMGYISAVRDENSGYRYYDDDGIFGVLNVKMHVKYGFSHEQIAKMQHFSLEQSIEAYKERMDEMDRQIAYMTYLRHQLKDDYVLMNKAAVNSDIYEKNSLDLRYVLYKYGEKLLQEPERLLQVKEFL